MTLIEHLVRRIRRSTHSTQIALATTVAPEDAVLVAEGERLQIPVFRGAVDDVLSRYLGAAETLGNPRTLVRVTGDCPLLDPIEIDRLSFALFRQHQDRGEPLDYLTNQEVKPDPFPSAMTSKYLHLRLSGRQIGRLDPGHREHVTPYLYRSGCFERQLLLPKGMDFKPLAFDRRYPRGPIGCFAFGGCSWRRC